MLDDCDLRSTCVTDDHGYVPILSSSMNFHRDCNKNNMADALDEQKLLVLPDHRARELTRVI
jgi:hypothetical protein